MIENPIIRGFAPDPSIVRVGEDYYIAVSTFEWWPGVGLYHSKDLKHWEKLKSPLRKKSQLNMIGNPPSGGIWAPDLTYSDGIFYLVYTDVKTKKGKYYNNHNYLVYTDDISGEWSEPIYLNSSGFDPSLFHSEDGKKYLVNMQNGFRGILLQELDLKNRCLKGERWNIFPGSGIGYTEGPHLYKIKDYYYLIVAEGGTGYEHCVTIARSDSLLGPYEVAPNNPILGSNSKEGSLQKCGHADIVETQYGEWYLVHLCSRPHPDKQKSVLGRETSIQKLCWSAEGWPALLDQSTTAQLQVEEPKQIAPFEFSIKKSRDDFDETELSEQYVTPRLFLDEDITLEERRGWLRLYGRESLNSLHHVNLVATRQSEWEVCVQTKMDFKPVYPEQFAGLVYLYDAYHFYMFGKTVDEEGNSVLQLIQSNQGNIEILKIYPVEQTSICTLQAKTDRTGDTVIFSYQTDENDWVTLEEAYTTDFLCDEYCRGFTGAHFGMYCHDMSGLRISADFDYWDYLK